MDKVMKEKNSLKVVKKTNILSTKFTDGMVVEDSDLTTAQQYPVDLMSTLFKAYFGCGIVCGFHVTRHPEGADRTKCVKVHPGTALDCHGYPFRLCEEVILKFKSEPCVTTDEPVNYYIAVRRKQEGEQGREVSDDKCGGGKAKCTNTRKRDVVVVRAFMEDSLPDNLCRITPNHPADPGDVDSQSSGHRQACACMKECPCDCCGNSWVLLARVEYLEKDCNVKCIDRSVRRYVKPIHCHCDAEPNECDKPVAGVDPNQDIGAQFMVAADNYNQLSASLSAQQSELTRLGDDLQRMQQVYFEQQQTITEERLEEIETTSMRKQTPVKKKVTKKTSTPRKKK